MERMAEAEIARQELRLGHPHDHADDAEDGADREIDMPCHDHQHHARGHDRDRRGLHGKVPQVARRQEGAAGQNVDTNPDQRQRAQHADEARVDLGGAEQIDEDRRAGATCSSRRPERSERPFLLPQRPLATLAVTGTGITPQGLDGARLHAAADDVLGHPAGLDDDIEVVPGDRHRRQQDGGHRHLARAVGPRLDARKRRELGALGKRHRRLPRCPAEQARVLPHAHRLRAERDTVQRRVVAVLARHRHRTGHALRRQCSDGAARRAVVRGHDRVDAVAVGGQELLHVALGVGRQPAVGIGLADVLDLAGLDRTTQHLELARMQEIGVGVGRRALDEDVIALGLHLEDLAGLDAADLLVVEGDVEDVLHLDETVVADHRDSLVQRLLDGGPDGVGVLRQHDQRLGAACDQTFDVGELLGRPSSGHRRET